MLDFMAVSSVSPSLMPDACDNLRVPQYEIWNIPKERGFGPTRRGGGAAMATNRDYATVGAMTCVWRGIWKGLRTTAGIYCRILAQAFWYSSKESTSIQPLKIGTASTRWPRSMSS